MKAGARTENELCVCVLSHVLLFATPWTVARQAPLSTGLGGVGCHCKNAGMGCYFLLQGQFC